MIWCVWYDTNKRTRSIWKMLGPFATTSRRTPPVLHCHSPGVATVARRLHIDVHNDINNNDNDNNAWQSGPLWPHGMGPKMLCWHDISHGIEYRNISIISRHCNIVIFYSPKHDHTPYSSNPVSTGMQQFVLIADQHCCTWPASPTASVSQQTFPPDQWWHWISDTTWPENWFEIEAPSAVRALNAATVLTGVPPWCYLLTPASSVQWRNFL